MDYPVGAAQRPGNDPCSYQRHGVDQAACALQIWEVKLMENVVAACVLRYLNLGHFQSCLL
jgi:hypothetical protein